MNLSDLLKIAEKLNEEIADPNSEAHQYHKDYLKEKHTPKRSPSQEYTYRVRLVSFGQSHYHWFSAPTKKEARKKARKFLRSKGFSIRSAKITETSATESLIDTSP